MDNNRNNKIYKEYEKDNESQNIGDKEIFIISIVLKMN